MTCPTWLTGIFPTENRKGQLVAQRSPTRPHRGSPQKLGSSHGDGTHVMQRKSIASGEAVQSESGWVSPYKAPEARAPLAPEERVSQSKAMLSSHGTGAARETRPAGGTHVMQKKSTASDNADQSESS